MGPILCPSFFPSSCTCIFSFLPSSLAFTSVRFFFLLTAASFAHSEIYTEPPALRSPRCALWRTRRRIEIERTRLVHSRILPSHPSTLFAYSPRSFVFALRATRARRAQTTEDVPSNFRSATSSSIHWRRHTCAHATSTYVTTKQTSRRTGPRRRRSYVNLHPLTYTTCVVSDEKLLDASATPYRL